MYWRMVIRGILEQRRLIKLTMKTRFWPGPDDCRRSSNFLGFRPRSIGAFKCISNRAALFSTDRSFLHQQNRIEGGEDVGEDGKHGTTEK
jgi:hypothetical protein